VNTTFLDFPDQGKCQKAAPAMNTSEWLDIGGPGPASQHLAAGVLPDRGAVRGTLT
jgi:hypothetical protein